MTEKNRDPAPLMSSQLLDRADPYNLCKENSLRHIKYDKTIAQLCYKQPSPSTLSE
jgi:hypothetical protein